MNGIIRRHFPRSLLYIDKGLGTTTTHRASSTKFLVRNKQYQFGLPLVSFCSKVDCRQYSSSSTILVQSTTYLPYQHNDNITFKSNKILLPQWYFVTSASMSQQSKKPVKEQTVLPEDDLLDNELPHTKLGIIARFKEMYKKYWYVLVPVHVVTSTAWLTGFYYLSKRYTIMLSILI